jgi:hypothetical protein
MLWACWLESGKPLLLATNCVEKLSSPIIASIKSSIRQQKVCSFKVNRQKLTLIELKYFNFIRHSFGLTPYRNILRRYVSRRAMTDYPSLNRDVTRHVTHSQNMLRILIAWSVCHVQLKKVTHHVCETLSNIDHVTQSWGLNRGEILNRCLRIKSCWSINTDHRE